MINYFVKSYVNCLKKKNEILVPIILFHLFLFHKYVFHANFYINIYIFIKDF